MFVDVREKIPYYLMVTKNYIIMAGVPTKHHSTSKVGRRRSHLALTAQNLVPCKECGTAVRPHRYCANCGYYKGKEVKAKIAKLVSKKK